MNRCHAPFLSHTLWRNATCLVALCALGTAVLAQPSTNLRAKAQRGVMQVLRSPEILLDGQAARLSPGARIRSASNLLVMPASLTGQSLMVDYVRESQGLVHEVWVVPQGSPGSVFP